MNVSFILNELGENREDYFNAISPPIVQTSNFAFKTVSGLRHALADEFNASIYSRGQNPTLTILSQKLAALDGAEDALLFNSGIGAISVTVLAMLKAGDHVIAIESNYGWTKKLFNQLLPKFGITATFVSGTEPSDFENAALPATRLIFLESPSSLTYQLQDIEKITAFAKSRGILTMIDNSYCTPLFQQPIKLGVDLVAQSATKYIGGHSDVVAGVVTGSKKLIKQIFDHEFMNLGPALSPHSAWLLLRGLRTLPLRLQRSFESTKIITGWLAEQKDIQHVIWPFNDSFSQAELARKQMQGCGGLFSLTLKDSSVAKIEAFCNSLQHILMGVSWGGHESLVFPSIASMALDKYDANNELHQYIRIYIGLEDPHYLIEDFKQALNKASLIE
jgi:cystathionine beta-lyase/cystathionine gamma-synthase